MALFQHLETFFKFLKSKIALFFSTTFQGLKKIREYLRKNNPYHDILIENCQLTSLYFLCIISTAKYTQGIINHYPPLVKYLIPFCEKICESPFFTLIGNNDAAMIYYPILSNIIFQRILDKVVVLSQRVRFHCGYVLLIDFLQNVVMHWALFYYSPEFLDEGELVYMYLPTAFSGIFLFFYVIYLYSYIVGLRSFIPVMKGPFVFLKPFVENATFSIGLINDAPREDNFYERYPTHSSK